MPDLKELYQQVLLEHSKQPRNFREMPNANRRAEGYNPLCGDRVNVYLVLDGDTIIDVSFTGSGCAICTSASSIMTQILKGKSFKQAQTLFTRFRELVTGQLDPVEDISDLEKLTVFSGVREYPIRVKCATLPWHTMKAALDNRQAVISTE